MAITFAGMPGASMNRETGMVKSALGLGCLLMIAALPAFGTNSNPVQRIAHDREVVSARLCNDEALALPIEKLDRQFSFKRLDLLAHRALRDTEPLPRRG
jgi:hypothetical protein